MTRKALILSAGVLGVALTAGAAQAGTKTWVGGTSSWNSASNWSPVGVPGNADDVVIGPPTAIGGVDPILDVTAQVQTLDMKNGGTLTFTNGHDLTVTGLVNVEAGGEIDINSNGSELIISGADMFDVDATGTVRINAASAVLRLSGASSAGNPIDGDVLLENAAGKLDITANVTVTGNGMIQGSDAGAQISIGSGSTFTSTMAAASGGIRGFMEIGGSGSFANNGLVFTDGGTLELASTLAGISGSGDWYVASTGTRKLFFSKGSTTISGDFVLAGEVEFAQNVTTSGQLTFNTGALIDVDTSGTAFQYQTFDANSSCGNPGTGSGPYTVSGNASCP